MIKYFFSLLLLSIASISWGQSTQVTRGSLSTSVTNYTKEESKSLIEFVVMDDSQFFAKLDELKVDKTNVFASFFLPRDSDRVIITICKSYTKRSSTSQEKDSYVAEALKFAKEKLFVTCYYFEGRQGWDDTSYLYRSDGTYQTTRERNWGTKTVIVDGFMITSSGFSPDKYPWKNRTGFKNPPRQTWTERILRDKESLLFMKENCPMKEDKKSAPTK